MNGEANLDFFFMGAFIMQQSESGIVLCQLDVFSTTETFKPQIQETPSVVGDLESCPGLPLGLPLYPGSDR